MNTTSLNPNLGRTLFALGSLVATRTAFAQLTPADVFRALGRHIRGDWGDVSDTDARANIDALHEGARLLSVYKSADGVTFWILTEADRSVTTVLLPEDY